MPVRLYVGFQVLGALSTSVCRALRSSGSAETDILLPPSNRGILP
jgi:hypothetical protein